MANLIDIVNDLNTLVGDTPVSEQINTALDKIYDEYVTRDEFNALKRKVEALIDIIGDVPVSE